MLLSTSVRRYAVGDGLLLLDTGSDRLFVYNPTACQLWNLVEDSATEEEVVSRFAAAWNLPASNVRHDVSSVLAEWRHFGLIGEAAWGSKLHPPTDAEAHNPGRDASPRYLVKWTSTIRDIAFAFTIEHELGSSVRAMLAKTESPEASADVLFEINQAPNDKFAFSENGVERIRSANPAQIVGALWQALLEQIHPGTEWLAFAHGGAVARHGEAVGICGPSGFGKSTLIGGLASDGFDYLSDDLLALTSPRGLVIPMPVPISIKPGSVDALALRQPQLAKAKRYQTKGVEARLLEPSIDAWMHDPVPLTKLVFPRFIAGAAAELQRVSSLAAIERLMADRIWLGYPMTEEKVAAFVAWIKEIPTYDFVYGDLAKALSIIKDLAA